MHSIVLSQCKIIKVKAYSSKSMLEILILYNYNKSAILNAGITNQHSVRSKWITVTGPLILSLLFVRSYDCLYWTTLSLPSAPAKRSISISLSEHFTATQINADRQESSNYLSRPGCKWLGSGGQCDETASAVTPGPPAWKPVTGPLPSRDHTVYYFIIIFHLSGWQGGFVNHNVEMAVGVWLKLCAGYDWAGLWRL